ncbi:MAG: photosynthetic complex assembly protein PuhC [Pseudomonadota bacterium]
MNKAVDDYRATVIPASPVPSILASGLIILTLGFVTFHQFVMAPAAAEREVTTPTPRAAIETSRLLKFEQTAEREVIVRDDLSGEMVDQIPDGESVFLRSVLRSASMQRRRFEVDVDAAFRLERLVDGAILLTDLATNDEMDLRAFGDINADDFTRYLSVTSEVDDKRVATLANSDGDD